MVIILQTSRGFLLRITFKEKVDHLVGLHYYVACPTLNSSIIVIVYTSISIVNTTNMSLELGILVGLVLALRFTEETFMLHALGTGLGCARRDLG